MCAKHCKTPVRCCKETPLLYTASVSSPCLYHCTLHVLISHVHPPFFFLGSGQKTLIFKASSFAATGFEFERTPWMMMISFGCPRMKSCTMTPSSRNTSTSMLVAGWHWRLTFFYSLSLSLSFFAFLLRGLFLFHGLVGPLVGARRHFLSVCHLLSR